MELLVPIVVGSSILAGAFVIYPATMFALDMSPYLYSNTRCSARSGLIINKPKYDSFVAATTQKEVMALLEDSYYHYIAEHASSFKHFSGMLEKDLFDTYQWLYRIMPDKLKPILKALKLKFEINDIKNILNNVVKNKEPGEPSFIEDKVIRLKLEGVKDFTSFLAVMENSQYSDLFVNATPENLAPLNNALDRFYMKNVLNEINKCKDEKAAMPFKEYWASNIDLVNLRLVLRKIVSGEEEISLIEGGALNKNEIMGINDLAQLDSIISSSVYNDFIESQNPFKIEAGIYKYLKTVAFNVGAKYTIKAGSSVKFIILKELEIRNLNIINKLKLENYPPKNIEKLIVV